MNAVQRGVLVLLVTIVHRNTDSRAGHVGTRRSGRYGTTYTPPSSAGYA